MVGDLLIASFFVATWLDPFVLGPDTPRDASLTLIFEFFFLHSTILFTGGKESRVKKTIGVIVYSPFLIVFAFAAGSPLIVLAFGYHAATMIISDWRTAGPRRNLVMGGYVITLLAFFASGAWAAAGILPAPPWAAAPPEGIGWPSGPEGRYDLVPVWGATFFLARIGLAMLLSPLGRDTALKRWVEGFGSGAG